MRYLISALLFVFSLPSSASEANEKLSVLAPFLGTWTSTSGSVNDQQTFQDISKWEWAYGGNVIRITHSINEGDYAGESLIHWDGVQGKIIYRYVTTASFYTDGVITPKEDGSIEVHEFVRGSETGPTESLSGYRVERGQLKTWSKFKTNGKWADPSEVTYNRTPDAKVIIKAPSVP